MREALPRSLRRTVMPHEFLACILRTEFRIAKVAARTDDDLRLPVSRDVREGRRLIVRDIHCDMLHPLPFLTLRILVPPTLLAWKTKDENVRPAIRIEVIGIGEEV